jgi:hypothetical protein
MISLISAPPVLLLDCDIASAPPVCCAPCIGSAQSLRDLVILGKKGGGGVGVSSNRHPPEDEDDTPLCLRPNEGVLPI